LNPKLSKSSKVSKDLDFSLVSSKNFYHPAQGWGVRMNIF